ncbi:MAG: regulator [Clostridia bacterium]|nr:regulator [Clostridia bacterium]
MNKIFTEKAPATVGPYSQATVSGGFVFTSGQLGIDSDGKISGDIAKQTENAIKNLSAVLIAAGSDLSKVVKTTCFLANISDFADFNEVYGRFFTEKPARTLIEASALPKGSLLEIEAVAEI